MSETTASGEDRPSAPPIRGMLLMLVWDIGLSLGAYYSLRLFGASPYVALLAGTIVSGLRMVYVAVKARRLDVFAGFLMTVFGVGLALSFVTGSIEFLLVKESFGTGVAGLLFLGSCVVGRPLIFYAAKRLQSDRADHFDSMWSTSAPFRRIFYVMSAVWGAGLLLEALVRIPLVFLLPVDVVAGLSTVMFVAAMVLLTVWTVGYVRRALRRRDAVEAASQ